MNGEQIVVLNIDGALGSRGLPEVTLREALRLRHGVVEIFEGRLNELTLAAATRPEVKDCAQAASLLRTRGVRVVLASALSPQVFAAVLDAAITAPGQFDHVIAVGGARSSRRNLVRTVLDELDVFDPAHVVAVACGPIDLYEAHAAQCGAIVAVARTWSAARELRRHPHTALVGSFVEAAESVAGPRRASGLVALGPRDASARVEGVA